LPFVLGIVLAAVGGCLVTLYKPAPTPTGAKRPVVAHAAEPVSGNVAGQAL